MRNRSNRALATVAITVAAGCVSGDDTTFDSSASAIRLGAAVVQPTRAVEGGPGSVDQPDLDEPCLDLDRCGAGTPSGSPTHDTRADAEPPAVDTCDDPYQGIPWKIIFGNHFTYYVLPGTAADTDIHAIAAAREQAYANIVEALGLTTEPIIDVYLSPNPVAAAAHGAATRRAYPQHNRYDVIYNGTADSFEVQRYGHELAHVLAHHLPTERPWALPILDEGLAEYLDQSYRNLHVAYAMQLNADRESRRYLTELDAGDVVGANHGRAGSLVQELISQYGTHTFLEIFKYTHLSRSGDCYTHPAIQGCVDTPAAVTRLLDAALQTHANDTWANFLPVWDGAAREAVLGTTEQLRGPDRDDIERLVATMDLGINDKTPTVYRATMDGFYCDQNGEQQRAEISARVVEAYDDVTSRVIAVYPTGIKNFSTAHALVERTEGRGVTYVMGVSFERIDGQWRQTAGPDWQ